MALLWLMATLLPGQICAATVDHGLRKGSADEARMVAGFCAREHIPHAIIPPASPISVSLQSASRAEPYRLLYTLPHAPALDHVVTVNHADDPHMGRADCAPKVWSYVYLKLADLSLKQ